ncbi:MAG: hypothetical protein PHQ74_03800 [Crocinitomicaceae bacterium]|nr:hypothetical protein [Crocinitomicaceae bacterium]
MVCLLPCSQENIEDINWRVDGKVKVIMRGSKFSNPKIILSLNLKMRSSTELPNTSSTMNLTSKKRPIMYLTLLEM